MEVKIKEQTKDKIVLEMEIELKGSMLEMEENILVALNQAGKLATGEALNKFDTNGEAIRIGGVKHTSKGKEKKSIRRLTEK
jgi:hypothetical protein